MAEPIRKSAQALKDQMRAIMELCEAEGQRNGLTLHVNPSTGYMRAYAWNADASEIAFDMYTTDGVTWYETTKL